MTTGEKYNFQYCPKLVIFNNNNEVLLCKRQGEEDFDGIFSFPGGKREKIDGSIEIGIEREKTEEIGNIAKIKMYRLFNIEEEYVKKSGDTMILPHYIGIYQGGEIQINEEYSEYKWVGLNNIDKIKIIGTIKPIVIYFLEFKNTNFFKNNFDKHSFII